MARTAVAYLRPSTEVELPAGLELVAVISDDDGDGLVRALHVIASGAAQTLFTPRLAAVAGSLGELVRLLDWLAETGADLVSTYPALDTASRSGRAAVALLREVDRWGREPDQSRRPRGRPGLSAGSPALAERIASMRERGLSLHAIADQLNREGVPTPRGGSQWRASSVQSALGYRRPRPPVPGAPPPPGRPGGRGPGVPARGRGPGGAGPRRGPGPNPPRKPKP